MTGLVRKATLLSVGGLLLAGAAMAGVPHAGNSTVPNRIVIYDGTSAGIAGALCADPNLRFTINDVTPLPVANATVVIDLNACSPDAEVGVCNVQPDPVTGTPGVTEGPTETLTYTANGSGQLCMTIFGTGAIKSPASARHSCANIYAGSTLMNTGGPVPVTITRHDNSSISGENIPDGFTTALDLSFVVKDVLLGPYNSRSDFNGSGTMDGTDLSLEVAAVFFWTAALPCTIIP